MSAGFEAAEKQLVWVEAMQQVQYTLHRAVRALDYGPPGDWADCFTGDGVYSAPGGEIAGAKALLQHASTYKPASHFVRHWVMAPDIEVEGDRAHVTSVMGAFDSNAEAGPHVSMMGRFVDAFVRCPDGRWRISRREAQVLSGKP